VVRTVLVFAVLALVAGAGHAETVPPPQYPIVLGWHQIVDDDLPLERSMPVVHLAEFEQTLRWLHDNGVRTLTIAEYCEAIRQPNPPRDAVLLTVDDGYESVYTELYPLLKRYGAHLTSFVITDRVGQENTVNPHQPWLNWDECRELQASGLVDIEVHAARSHQQIKGKAGKGIVLGPWLTTRLYNPKTHELESEATYEQRVADEFVEARLKLTEEMGRAPRSFCWPYGVTNDYARKACRDAGFEVTFTLKQVTADPSCRRRYHFPDEAAKALQLIEKHDGPPPQTESGESTEASVESDPGGAPTPETSARAATPAAEPVRAPEKSRGLGAVLMAALGATLIWGVFYLLLFRDGD
jgi:poly-beta-1,6-N-acetyl-D-glucosamine N-deacetylase